MTAIKSIQLVTIDDLDQVVCGLGDGRVLQFYVDLGLIDKIINQPDSFPP